MLIRVKQNQSPVLIELERFRVAGNVQKVAKETLSTVEQLTIFQKFKNFFKFENDYRQESNAEREQSEKRGVVFGICMLVPFGLFTLIYIVLLIKYNIHHKI